MHFSFLRSFIEQMAKKKCPTQIWNYVYNVKFSFIHILTYIF